MSLCTLSYVFRLYPPFQALGQLVHGLKRIRSQLDDASYSAFVSGELSTVLRAAAADSPDPGRLLDAVDGLFYGDAISEAHLQQLMAAAGGGLTSRALAAVVADEGVGSSSTCGMLLCLFAFVGS